MIIVGGDDDFLSSDASTNVSSSAFRLLGINNMTCWIGLDPGGHQAFGIAVLRESNDFETEVVNCLDDAISRVEQWVKSLTPKAIGIDAPLWWSSAEGGSRAVDDHLRRRYGLSPGTVQSPNSLRGAVANMGPLAAKILREKYPKIKITETHPKALLRAYQLKRLTDDGAKAVERFVDLHEAASIVLKTDHERDALLGAFAAREGDTLVWNSNLSKLDRYDSELSLWVDDVNYWWPET
jgi:predicted nuclease with RNAse H fold